MSKLLYITIEDFNSNLGRKTSVKLSYQVFGRALHSSPIVLVNHALTGNSQVSGENGWWKSLIGPNKCIDTNRFTVLAFNVPGNGFDGETNDGFKDYKSLTARTIAELFCQGLERLNITKLFAIIGASVGGGITWEMAALQPHISEHIIPIATDWKSTDWLIANCHIQDMILNHSTSPIADARLHAMTLYRTPESLTHKFKRSTTESGQFNVESWLNHHGETLENRFKLPAYKLMNQLLKTIDITRDRESFVKVASAITSNIYMITINSDLFFKPEENWSSYVDLKPHKDNLYIHEINSIHGHDAFLIEFEQLQRFLKPVFGKTQYVNQDFALIGCP